MNPFSDPTLEEFGEAVAGPDDEIDLARAALAVARWEYPGLRPDEYLESLSALAARARARVARDAAPIAAVESLVGVLFNDWGLKGATEDYYDPRNSFVNEVMERRVGIPVSLAVIFMSAGARAGIPLAGTAMPMHFLVRALGVKPALFVDCFNRGKILTEEQCREAIRRMSGGRISFRPDMLDAVGNGQVLTRLLNNLKAIYHNNLQYRKELGMLDRLQILNPDEPGLLRERGFAHYHLGQGDLARQDLQAYLETDATAEDAEEIRKLLRRIG